MKQLSRVLVTLTVTLALTVDIAAGSDLNLSLPSMGQPADQAMTPSEEARLGEELMDQLRRNLPVVDDPVVNAFVTDLGTRLASHAGGGAQPFHFFVIDNPSINAFAMPGGYIGVHTGVITAAHAENELASVMAHEIAHVTQRHLARRMLAGKGTGLRTAAMVLAGLILASQDPQAGAAATMGGIASGAQSQLNFSREFEREADRIGIDNLAASGFDPAGMPTFFERLMEANQYRAEPPPFLSTHPLTQERIADARSRANSTRVQDPFSNPAFPYVRARLLARRGDDAGARVAEFRTRLEDEDHKPAETYGLAVALIDANRASEAIPKLRELMETQGEYAILYTTLAEAQLATNAPKDALASLDEGLSLYPGDYALRYRRIESLIRADRPRDALQAASSTARDFPEDVSLLQLRARAADAAGDQAEAALAMAEYYVARGDLRSGLDQVERVVGDPSADPYQQSRAKALQDRWRQTLRQREE